MRRWLVPENGPPPEKPLPEIIRFLLHSESPMTGREPAVCHRPLRYSPPVALVLSISEMT